MKFVGILLLVSTFVLNVVVQAEDSPMVVSECSDLHRVNIQKVKTGHFSNNYCQLNCQFDDNRNTTDPVNEGYLCDPIEQRRCRDGHCVHTEAKNSLQVAVAECADLHRMPLGTLNTDGTKFDSDDCLLTCVFDGHILSRHAVHEGQTCYVDFTDPRKRQCYHGECMLVTRILEKTSTTTPKSVL